MLFSIVYHPSYVIHHISYVVLCSSEFIRHHCHSRRPSSFVRRTSSAIPRSAALVRHPSSVVRHPSYCMHYVCIRRLLLAVHQPLSVVLNSFIVTDSLSSIMRSPFFVFHRFPSDLFLHQKTIHHCLSVVLYPSPCVPYQSSDITHFSYCTHVLVYSS